MPQRRNAERHRWRDEREERGKGRERRKRHREKELWRHKEINRARCWGVVWGSQQEQILGVLKITN